MYIIYRKMLFFCKSGGERQMKYVSDIVGEDYKNWAVGESVLISSPTGSGKTTFILKKLLPYAMKQNKQIVYLCNRKILHRQFAESTDQELLAFLENHDTPRDARNAIHVVTYQYCEVSKQFPQFTVQPDLTGYTKEQRILKKTRKELPQPFEINEDDILYYVFDEAHYFLSDSLFNENVEYWFRVRFSSKGINVFLTATPDPFLIFLAMKDKKGILFENMENVFKQYRKKSHLRKEMEKVGIQVKVFLKSNTVQAKATYNNVCDINNACREIEPYSAFITCLQEEKDRVACRRYPSGHDYNIYPNITAFYFSKWDTILSEIKKSAAGHNRWLVFLDDEREGIRCEAILKTWGIPTVLLSAATISRQEHAQAEFLNIVKQRAFHSHVLIATSVMDCGVSIEDEYVKNIVIAEHDKTTFLQMLGRKRMKEGERIHVYVKHYSSKAINGVIHKYDQYLRALTTFALLNKSDSKPVHKPSENSDSMWEYPLISNQERRDLIDKITKTGINHFLRPTLIPSKHQDEILGEYELRTSAYIGLIFHISEYLDAMNEYRKSEDPQFFLKRQLSWIHKEYREEAWVGYYETRDKLIHYLETNEGCWLNKNEQKEFSWKCHELFAKFPVPPQILMKDYSRYQQKGQPGLNKLKKALQEKEIPFHIIAKSRMRSGERRTYWKVTKNTSNT